MHRMEYVRTILLDLSSLKRNNCLDCVRGSGRSKTNHNNLQKTLNELQVPRHIAKAHKQDIGAET